MQAKSTITYKSNIFGKNCSFFCRNADATSLNVILRFGIPIKNQVVIKLKPSIYFLGIDFAVKLMKTKKNGGKRMSSMEKDVVLTTDEAIQYLRISKPTFLKYIRLGRIKAIKAGNGWRVLQSELYRFLKEG